jgi:phospholipid/cholesterol/gamma-HCH transport system substrate-binding protein
MNAPRLVAVGVLVAAALVVGMALIGSDAPHTYRLQFQTAGQLVKGDDVQVGGRRIGSVDEIRLTDDNQAEITIGLEEFGPLHAGTKAVIRQTSLSGVANRYVALFPGPNNGTELADGATLRTDATTTPVDLDQLFASLDPQTRQSLRNVVRGSARQYAGRGREANAALRYLNPALSTLQRATAEVVGDQRTLEEFLRSSSRVVGTLAERRGELTELVTNANATTKAIGDENASLGRALGALPRTLRRGSATFAGLRATLDDLDRLVAVAKPATKRLAPFLRELRPLVADARPTIADLRNLVRRRGGGNDLIDLLLRTPRLERVAEPAFADTTAALRKTTPVLDFARPFTPDLVGLLRELGQAASNYDANGHFARIQPIFNAFSVVDDPAGPLLRPVAPADRQIGLQSGMLRRCPGAASQAAADGSAPWRDAEGDLDCDPSQVLPGP